MKKLLLATAILALTAAPPVQAQTGMEFYNRCGNGFTGGFINRDFCHGFVLGVGDGLSATGRICYTPGTTDEQLMMIAQNWLRAHPQNLNRSAAYMISNAFIAAYPCH